MNTVKLYLKDILQKFHTIKIPDIQRDYVMGSGGDKLVKLFDAMKQCLSDNKEFSFSCLVGYEDDQNNLYIYDGQQRIATIICLCSYLNEDEKIGNQLNKFSFIGREVASEWLKNPKSIDKEQVIDFSTYSICELIHTFKSKILRFYQASYLLDFFLNKVYFDVILVDKISDAEQFFLDINDGLDLKSYEIYKAALYHHASEKLEKDDFKRIALKMENEWLKFFLGYRGNYYEEESLIYYLQYCFRMMWIEEKGTDTGYNESDVSWLEKNHFERIEKITDEILKVLDNNSIQEINCINYSIACDTPRPYGYLYEPYIGWHWNIKDNDYIAMLYKFIKNINSKQETKKDILIWCYISNLSKYNKNSKALYEYLRMIKKILNHDRAECKNAYVDWHGKGVANKKITYAKYYVKGIPNYYLKMNDYYKRLYKQNIDNNEFFYSIISLNSLGIENENYLDEWIDNCNNKELYNILLSEKIKQKSSEYEIIRNLDNLPFINGLVDNFIMYDYEKEYCILKQFTYTFWEKLNSIKDLGYQYKDILKFICDNKLNIDNCKFNDITIKWNVYTGTEYTNTNTELIAHTWCDLFTSQNGIEFSNDFKHSYLDKIPDGWIRDEMIIQPKDTTVNGKNGFAGGGSENNIFLMSNLLSSFLSNFSCISINSINKDKNYNKYCIDGVDKNILPSCLYSHNYNNSIDNYIIKYEKVYYANEDYLNDILLQVFKYLYSNIDINKYVENNKNNMRFEEMYGIPFFIKL